MTVEKRNKIGQDVAAIVGAKYRCTYHPSETLKPIQLIFRVEFKDHISIFCIELDESDFKKPTAATNVAARLFEMIDSEIREWDTGSIVHTVNKNYAVEQGAAIINEAWERWTLNTDSQSSFHDVDPDGNASQNSVQIPVQSDIIIRIPRSAIPFLLLALAAIVVFALRFKM